MSSVLASVKTILKNNFESSQFYDPILYFDTHTTLADLLAHLSTFDDDFLVEHQTDIIQCFSYRDRDRIAAICCDLFWDYQEERAAGASAPTFSKISAIDNTGVEYTL